MIRFGKTWQAGSVKFVRGDVLPRRITSLRRDRLNDLRPPSIPRLVVAAQEDGKGIGRIRMRRVRDASAASLLPFILESVEPGSVVHTDGWDSYVGLQAKGYRHEVTVLRGRKESASELLPRVHRVVSLHYEATAYGRATLGGSADPACCRLENK